MPPDKVHTTKSIYRFLSLSTILAAILCLAFGGLIFFDRFTPISIAPDVNKLWESRKQEMILNRYDIPWDNDLKMSESAFKTSAHNTITLMQKRKTILLSTHTLFCPSTNSRSWIDREFYIPIDNVSGEDIVPPFWQESESAERLVLRWYSFQGFYPVNTRKLFTRPLQSP
jgi:hypothetical protein